MLPVSWVRCPAEAGEIPAGTHNGAGGITGTPARWAAQQWGGRDGEMCLASTMSQATEMSAARKITKRTNNEPFHDVKSCTKYHGTVHSQWWIETLFFIRFSWRCLKFSVARYVYLVIGTFCLHSLKIPHFWWIRKKKGEPKSKTEHRLLIITEDVQKEEKFIILESTVRYWKHWNPPSSKKGKLMSLLCFNKSVIKSLCLKLFLLRTRKHCSNVVLQ